MIVGSVVTTLDIPHEPGNSIMIRELSGLEMDDAAEIKSTKVLKRLGALGAETIDAIRGDRPQEVTDQKIDPADNYDMEYVISKAVVGWKGPQYDHVECTTEHKRLLDKVTLDWLMKEIITRNTVPEGE